MSQRSGPPRDHAGPESARLDIARSRSEDRTGGENEWIALTVVFFDRHVALLDDLARRLTVARGTTVGRSEIIRALIDEFAEGMVDSSASTRETRLLSRLPAAPTR